MRPTTKSKHFVVVPDGLKANQDALPIGEPSFVFKSVLDWLLLNLNQNDVVFLAPANKFGGKTSEQRAAELYLKKQGASFSIVAFDVDDEGYIDTRGNALYLRQFLKEANLWPLHNAILVSYSIHSHRAETVFKQEGFVFEDTVRVRIKHQREPIVNRLWYYRIPVLHRLYEAVAFFLFYLRIR